MTILEGAMGLQRWEVLRVAMNLSMTADIVSSFLAAVGCIAVLSWIVRTPGRSELERRSIPLLATLAAIYAVRCASWLAADDSIWRWAAFWPSTVLPLVMALFVEGLLRRHLPMWIKVFALAMTAAFMAQHAVPRFDLRPGFNLVWPVGLVATMAVLARQLWVMRNAGLSRQERRMIAGVVVASIIAMPLVATDSRLFLDSLSLRLGGAGGLLFLRSLVTPAGGDGLRDAVAGSARAFVRATLIAAMVFVVLPGARLLEFGVALELALCLILVFDLFDRLRRRRPREVDTQLLHWLATAPTDNLDSWRRAIRHAPLVGDAVVLDPDALARYDAAALRAVLEQHGPVVSAASLRALAATTSNDGRGNTLLEGIEQAMDLLAVHDATHIGLLSAEPLRVLATNLPYVGGRDTELQLRVILRTGQEAAERQ